MHLTESIFKDVTSNLCDGVRLIDTEKNVVFWNKGAEIITGYNKDEMLGLRCNRGLKILHGQDRLDLCEDNCETEHSMCSRPGEETAFIRHKEGHLVPVIMCVYPVRGKDGDIVGTAEMFHDLSWKVAALDRIEELSKMMVIDPLTGVGNRRYAEITLTAKLEEYKRFNLPFGVSYLDIDDFKKVNDTYGHNNGDALLKIIARTLKGCLRSYDSLCRMGGDEFIVIMSNLDSIKALSTLSDRFMALVKGSTLTTDGKEVQATVSIGSTMVRESDTMDSIISRADSLMYESKSSGKNRLSLS